MGWQQFWRNLRSVLRPALAPIVLGTVTGGLALMVLPRLFPAPAVKFSQLAKPQSVSQAIASHDSETETAAPRIRLPAALEKTATRNDLLDVYQKPRAAAVDLTRRLEDGLPPPPDRSSAAVAPSPSSKQRAPAAASIRPMIAIVIDDMGYDRVNSARAVRLPPSVTLSYMPFAPNVRFQVRKARLMGHQIMLHLPMEADDQHGHPGPNMLAVADSPAVLMKQLNRMLGRFSGYVGVNNHEGSRFTRDRKKMTIVLRELKRRGLFFLNSKTIAGTVGPEVARKVGIPYAVRDVFLDDDADPAKIRAQMAEVERLAKRTGQAIAIGHPRKNTMDVLAPWLRTVRKRGFRLVSVSRLLKYPSAGKRVAQNVAGE